MRKLLTLLAAIIVAAVVVGSCASAPSAPPPPLPDPIGIIEPGAGVEDAKDMLWPFLWSGFLIILAGVAYGIFLKNWKLLLVGMAIAAVPPLLFLFFKPLVVPIGYMILFCGLCGCVYVGYLVYDKIEDDIQQERKEDQADGLST